MKISCWNVNGLRAVMRKGDWEVFLSSNPGAVICLQEIKTELQQLSDDQRSKITHPHQFWNPAKRKGYSGVLTLAEVQPDEVIYGLGEKQFDQEGRAIQTRFGDTWLINVYVPNGSRDHSRVGYKLAFYEKLLEVCEAHCRAGAEVILCGDINTAHQEIDLKNARANQNTTGFLPEERAWVTRFIEAGFIDIFRVRYPAVEKYTWWSYVTRARVRNVGWRLDYFLISNGVVPRVQDAVIREEILGSDHCPVELILT